MDRAALRGYGHRAARVAQRTGVAPRPGSLEPPHTLARLLARDIDLLAEHQRAILGNAPDALDPNRLGGLEDHPQNARAARPALEECDRVEGRRRGQQRRRKQDQMPRAMSITKR